MLDHNDPEQAKRQQNEAADAFQQLRRSCRPIARGNGQGADRRGRSARTACPIRNRPRKPANWPRSSASCAIKCAARRKKLAETAAPKANPVGELAKQQQEVAKQAAEIAKQTGEERGKESSAAHEAGEAKSRAKRRPAK